MTRTCVAQVVSLACAHHIPCVISMRSCCVFDSLRVLHFPLFAVYLLSYHPVFLPGHQLHLPRCGGQISCALQLMRTLPSTTLSHTVLTFISHVSLQVYRKPSSMFTTYPLPEAEVLGYEVSLATASCSRTGNPISHTRPAARTVFSGGRIPGHESILATSDRGALPILGQLEESFVFSAVIGVFASLSSASGRMHRKRASRSWCVKDVASWLRRLVGSQSGQG